MDLHKIKIVKCPPTLIINVILKFPHWSWFGNFIYILKLNAYGNGRYCFKSIWLSYIHTLVLITQAVPFSISKLQNTFNSILYSIVHFPLSSEHMEKRIILGNNYTYVYNLPSLSVQVQCENPFHLFTSSLYRFSSPFFQLNVKFGGFFPFQRSPLQQVF